MIGDITNLLGCILTKQLPFQTLLATYYCVIDSCLVCQYFLYNVIRRPSVVVIEGLEQADTGGQPRRSKWKFNTNAILVLAMLVSGAAAHEDHDSGSQIQVIGTVAAWSSSLLYFTSRLPQMSVFPVPESRSSTNLFSYKNYTRKSTEGLSVLLFIAAFLGNLFYTLSIITSPFAWPSESQTEVDSWNFISGALPFLIGSAGTLCFDVAIVTQWAYYRPARPFFNLQFTFQRIGERRHAQTGLLQHETQSNYGSMVAHANT